MEKIILRFIDNEVIILWLFPLVNMHQLKKSNLNKKKNANTVSTIVAVQYNNLFITGH